jgi:hypothetical protein
VLLALAVALTGTLLLALAIMAMPEDPSSHVPCCVSVRQYELTFLVAAMITHFRFTSI